VIGALAVCASSAPAAHAVVMATPTVVMNPLGTILAACSPEPSSTVTLTGTVNPNGDDTTWYFDYEDGTTSPMQDAGSGTSPVAVSVTVTTTVPGLHYVHLVARNSSGPAQSPDDHFSVVGLPCELELLPTVTSPVAGTPVPSAPQCSTGSVTFSVNAGATVTPAQSTTDTPGTATVLYGPTTDYGESSASVPMNAASTAPAPVAVAATISGLPYGTTHYAVQFSNMLGLTVRSDDATIDLPVPPCPPPIPSVHTADVGVHWVLVSFSKRHRSAVIRYQPPCGATSAPAKVDVTHHNHLVRIGVRAAVQLPAGSCVTLTKARRVTVVLPRGTTAGRLRHAT
jgi:hypothetical protein